jgi:hypothetical protein
MGSEGQGKVVFSPEDGGSALMDNSSVGLCGRLWLAQFGVAYAAIVVSDMRLIGDRIAGGNRLAQPDKWLA